jgi:hypothetical protein
MKNTAENHFNNFLQNHSSSTLYFDVDKDKIALLHLAKSLSLDLSSDSILELTYDMPRVQQSLASIFNSNDNQTPKNPELSQNLTLLAALGGDVTAAYNIDNNYNPSLPIDDAVNVLDKHGDSHKLDNLDDIQSIALESTVELIKDGFQPIKKGLSI